MTTVDEYIVRLKAYLDRYNNETGDLDLRPIALVCNTDDAPRTDTIVTFNTLKFLICQQQNSKA